MEKVGLVFESAYFYLNVLIIRGQKSNSIRLLHKKKSGY